MRSLLLLVVMGLFGITQMNSQTNLRFGVNGGVPVADAGDFTTFQLGADIAYAYDFINTVEVGGLIGYSHFFGEDGYDSVKFVPLAVTGRVSLATFFVGTDIGYAVGLGNGGGFYFRPKVGYNFILLNVVASYSEVSRGGNNFPSVNLGVEIGI